MSIKVMTYVWDHSPHTGSDLLMLLAIADHANDQGRAWPSIPTLARKCRVGKRMAIYIIQKLEKAGSITIEHGGGRGHASVYTVKGATECTDCKKGATECTLSEEKVQQSAPISEDETVQCIAPIEGKWVQSSDIKGAMHCTPTIIEPSRRENLNTKTHAREKNVRTILRPDYSPGFLQFWTCYPPERRASKPSCLGVWRAADLEPRAAEICEKIERLKATSWRDCQPTYIPMPLTWLNQGRYEDDLMPMRRVALGGRLSQSEQRTAAASQRIVEEMHRGPTRAASLFRRLE